jgi:thiamine pyrophosphokinase
MDYVVILNGVMPELSNNFFDGKKIICADGAYLHAEKMGVKPDLVIGDFDSLDAASVLPDIETVKFSSDKDYTDGELAVREAIKRGAKNIEIIGAAGKREDHFYANFILLYIALKSGANASIITDYTRILMFDGDISVNVQEGSYVSIVPFTGPLHIINTEGLKYKIRDGVIGFDCTLGISNVATSGNVKINLKSGCGILFIAGEKAF